MSVTMVETLRLTLGLRVNVTLAHPVLKTSLVTEPWPSEWSPTHAIVFLKNIEISQIYLVSKLTHELMENACN